MQTNPNKTREQLHRSILSSVSHDLKTPLACIIGSLEIYERSKEKLSPEKQAALLHTALQEAYRLDSFITNILDMARLESAAIIVKKELCMMDLLLEDCRITLGRRLNECTIHIEAIGEAFPVTTDPILLMRAICIILENAAKYGMLHPLIRVEYEKIGDQVVIRIQNNGPGIPPEVLENIFSKTARLAIGDHKIAGTGLGLPICREIMRLLDGTVTVTNVEDGQGVLCTLAFAG